MKYTQGFCFSLAVWTLDVSLSFAGMDYQDQIPVLKCLATEVCV